ncbi:hypothetical protein ACOSQ3_032627 [Xanthoceras sorbifolium]
MSRDVGLFLGEMIGKVLKVDPGSSEDCLGKFIRVRALVDVGKRFRRMLRVIIGEPEVECVVILKFERIPNFCYFCRRVGHLVRECLDNVNSIVDESLLKFGSWMRAIGPSFNRSRGRESRTDTEDGSNRKENSDPNPIRKDDDACKPSPISSPLKNKNANRGTGEAKDVDFGLSSGISLGSTVNDGGEVTSPRGRRWKCLARENVAILNTESSLDGLGKWSSRFHFEETWTREDNYKSIVEEAWNSVSCRYAVRGVKSSFDAVASLLISWSRAAKKERNA